MSTDEPYVRDIMKEDGTAAELYPRAKMADAIETLTRERDEAYEALEILRKKHEGALKALELRQYQVVELRKERDAALQAKTLPWPNQQQGLIRE